MTKKRIHLIYSILLSAGIILAGISLMIACVGIYRSGDQPFSREAVAAAFSQIAVPVYLCLGLIVGGILLNGFAPLPRKKQPVEKQYGVILDRMYRKMDSENCDQELLRTIRAEETRRKRYAGIGWALLGICSVVFLSYGLNSANFHQSEINSSMIKAMGIFLPCLAIPFAWAVFSAYSCRASIRREIALLRQAPAVTSISQVAATKGNHNCLLAVRYGILVVGIGILIYGFFAGGTSDVLTKAINICTECVGLG